MEIFEISLYFDEKVFRGVFIPLVVTMRFQIYPKFLQHPLPASTVSYILGLTPSSAMAVSLGLSSLLFRKPPAICSGN